MLAILGMSGVVSTAHKRERAAVHQAGVNRPRASTTAAPGGVLIRAWGGYSLSEESKASKTASEAARAKALEKDWKTVSAFLREHPGLLRQDADLLADLGLWIKATNIVEFGPAALARLSAAKIREKAARHQLEATARANFAAQAQTHAAVTDL